jgi:hypothetical protein
LIAAVPIHDDRAEHNVSADDDALDAHAVLSLETRRVRGKDAGNESLRLRPGIRSSNRGRSRSRGRSRGRGRNVQRQDGTR